MQFDSKDEELFWWWLEEAETAGLIHIGKRCEKGIDTREVIHPVVKTYEKQLKTKVKYIKRTLLRELSYTPDFELLVEKGGVFDREIFPEGKFTGKYVYVIVDVKSSVGNAFGNNQTAVTFPIIQKVLYHLHGVYVHKVVVKKLFKKTWCPAKAYWMNGRKIPTKTKLGKQCKLIDEYLKEKK